MIRRLMLLGAAGALVLAATVAITPAQAAASGKCVIKGTAAFTPGSWSCLRPHQCCSPRWIMRRLKSG